MPNDHRIDTHNPAVQASSARLIMILKDAYPLVESLTGTALESQASLLHYIQFQLGKLNMSPAEIAVAKQASSIKAVIRFIDAIIALPTTVLADEDKMRVLTEIQVIASIYPGGVWNEQHRQWSTNQFYNSKTKVTETITTSPAEALNLVCHALFDHNRFAGDASEEVHDLEKRLETVYTDLLSLRVQTESGHLEKCSAGLQHDILYWLNGGFLDKPKSEGGKPVQLLLGTVAFLKDSLVEFVSKQMSLCRDPSQVEALLDAWLKNREVVNEDDDEEEDHPLIIWLRRQFVAASAEHVDSGWKTACLDYMRERCGMFYINPETCKLSEYLETIAAMEIPNSHNPVVATVNDIQGMKPIVLPEHFAENSIFALMHLRNTVLGYFRKHISQTVWKNSPSVIFELFSALSCVDSLYRYRDVTLFLGSEEGVFAEKRQALQRLLSAYLEGYTFKKRLPETYEATKADYNAQERVFQENGQVDFISSYFALQDGSEKSWKTAWQRLQALQPSSAAVHPLVLSDERLRIWHSESQSLTPDGALVVDLTPYAINRLFLHGLLVPPRQWTVLYAHYLQVVSGWLLSVTERQGLVYALKKAYPHYLLSNLYFISVMKNLESLSDASKETIWSLLSDDRRSFFKKSYFVSVLALSNKQLSSEQKTVIWSAVEGRLVTLIQDVWQLRALLKLPNEDLSQAQKTVIWEAVEGRLVTLIQDDGQLSALLAFPNEQLSQAQKTVIWEAVKERLVTLIQDGRQLSALLALPNEQLSQDQKAVILEAVKGRLVTLIQDGWQLRALLALPNGQLSQDQKAVIWDAVEGRLATLIQDSVQLSALLKLPNEDLSQAQKTVIWEAVEGRLAILIQSDEGLSALLALPNEQLSQAQKTVIWSAVEERLVTLIQDGRQLSALLALPNEQLSQAQKTVIWEAVKERLVTLIKNGRQLSALLKLPNEQLSQAQKTVIWEAVEGRLVTLIQDVWQLKSLFELPNEQLSQAQKTVIWEAVKERLVTMIQERWQLRDLLELPNEQLSQEQKTVILAAVKGKLAILIESGWQLSDLLKLPNEQLSQEQKVFIWAAVHGQPGNDGGRITLNMLSKATLPELAEFAAALLAVVAVGDTKTDKMNSASSTHTSIKELIKQLRSVIEKKVTEVSLDTLTPQQRFNIGKILEYQQSKFFKTGLTNDTNGPAEVSQVSDLAPGTGQA